MKDEGEIVSYFSARVGQRPGREEGGGGAGGREVGSGEAGSREQESGSYFGARLGPLETNAPNSPIPHSPIPTPQSLISNCPLCRGTLVQEGGLYRCQGRCGARWVQESPGRLVDLAALPLGVCACCERPQALVQGERGAVCPGSGQDYLLLPDGETLPATAAPHGVCQCCVPPLPLLWWEEHLVCQAKPNNCYQRVGSQVSLVSTAQTNAPTAETLQAIDAALRRNSARVTVYGLFDVE